MQPPFSHHARFFSSLKQVEERLASEEEKRITSPARPIDPIHSSEEDLSSPLYLVAVPVPALLPDSSGPPPHEFLSSSPQIPEEGRGAEADDDIEQLMALLGIEDGAGGWGCGGRSGFYSRIAGVKGPRSEAEARRLDGWIEYYAGAGERKEPARLAHLLLAKAAWLSVDDDDGLAAVEFPLTVEDFLEHHAPHSNSDVQGTN